MLTVFFLQAEQYLPSLKIVFIFIVKSCLFSNDIMPAMHRHMHLSSVRAFCSQVLIARMQLIACKRIACKSCTLMHSNSGARDKDFQKLMFSKQKKEF